VTEVERPLFERFAAALPCAESSHEQQLVFDGLLARYREPHRHYHNLDHVVACLNELLAARDLVDDPRPIEAALWFHDAVYDPTRSDNEERSADLADASLASMGCDDDFRQRVRRLILATKHRASPVRSDERLMVDVDLSILGQRPGVFDRYEAAIRREYAHVGEAEFCAGRAAFLQRLLARPLIYSTDRFREKYERSARENIARSIAKLRDDGPGA
jgi:predicted metal-dependent HD superfamily phosphohydrolase